MSQLKRKFDPVRSGYWLAAAATPACRSGGYLLAHKYPRLAVEFRLHPGSIGGGIRGDPSVEDVEGGVFLTQAHPPCPSAGALAVVEASMGRIITQTCVIEPISS